MGLNRTPSTRLCFEFISAILRAASIETLLRPSIPDAEVSLGQRRFGRNRVMMIAEVTK